MRNRQLRLACVSCPKFEACLGFADKFATAIKKATATAAKFQKLVMRRTRASGRFARTSTNRPMFEQSDVANKRGYRV